MREKIFTGTASALVTPFKDGLIDYNCLGRLIEDQIEAGINALVIAGTTGEASTMPDDEHIQLIAEAVRFAGGRIPIIGGTGSNDTEHGIALSKAAERVGADALLLVTPYYNKTNQRGLVEHYKATAAAVDLPLILYNVPSRTALNIAPTTYETLASVENIVAIKECNIAQVADTRQLCGDRFDHYSGEDGLVVPLLSLGGSGVISVVSNVAPVLMREMTDAWFAGDIVAARDIQIKLMPLINACFTDVNPIPVKAMMNLLGKYVGDPRLPLVAHDEKHLPGLKDLLSAYNLI